MSADALGRRIAVQERIERAKQLVAHAEEATRELTFGDATLDTLDGDGHVRRALRALLPVAVNAVGFDVVVGLGTDPTWGVRIYHEGDSVEVAAVTLSHTAATDVAGQPDDPDDVVSQLADLLRG